VTFLRIKPEGTFILEKTGSFGNSWFKKRPFTTKMTPRQNQSEVINLIWTHYSANGHTIAFLHGPPGTGKSMIGLFLAMRAGTYCNSFKPWQPGDSLGSLYCEIEPTSEKPLVIVMDEFDCIIQRIHEGIHNHKSIPISTQNKAGWNAFVDEISRGMYPNLILILTSNKSPEFLNSLDPSYTRRGRIDVFCEMTEEIF